MVPTWRVNQPDERSPSAASIQRTLHSQTVSVEYMSINHRRFHIVVPQKALHGENFVTNFLCAVGVMLEAIASRIWSSSFLRWADSIAQLHNTNIKYNLNNTYVLKTKRKISGSLLPIYPWEGYHAEYSFPIHLVGMKAAGNLSIYPARRYR